MVASPRALHQETTAPSVLQRYLAELDDGLRGAMTRGDAGLLRPLHYHMGWVDPKGVPTSGASGKAMRPTLCLFICEAVGGAVAQAMPAALALELVHNFSLIHDDIQDGDRERHSRPTVWAVWGEAQALVVGNAMRAMADSALLQLEEQDIAREKALGALAILTQRYLEMIEGQYLDLSYESRLDVTPDEYLTMVGKKTGALVEAAIHLGAYLGTEDSGQVQALRRCGRSLGLAFQARDDVLGVWGDEAKTGKAVGADIQRKKKSLPVVYTFHTAGAATRNRLVELYSQEKLDAGSVAEVLGIMEELGAQGFAQSVAEERRDEAVTWVRRARLPAWAQEELEALSDFMVYRQH